MKKKSKPKFRLVFCQFSISSWRDKGHEPSRVELKILQLELWLEPARLGLITSKLVSSILLFLFNHVFLRKFLGDKRAKPKCFSKLHCKYIQWNYSRNGTHVKSVHFTSICHIQSNVEVTFIPLYLKQQLNVHSAVTLQWKAEQM